MQTPVPRFHTTKKKEKENETIMMEEKRRQIVAAIATFVFITILAIIAAAKIGVNARTTVNPPTSGFTATPEGTPNYEKVSRFISGVDEIPVGNPVRQSSETEAEVSPLVSQDVYTVKANDTWWTISSRYYGSGLYSFGLADYNGKSPYYLYVGDKIIIPEKDDEEFISYCEKYYPELNSDD